MLTLSESEKKILSGITFHTEEIESGNLCDSDMELLTEMRGLAEYLPEKYPSYTFEITGCEPKEGTIRPYNEWYYKSKQIDRDSAFIATVENTDDALEIKDDFYGEVIRTPIKEDISKLLSDNGYPVIDVVVSFWKYLGKDYGENLVPKQVLSGEIQADNDFKIFLDASKLNTTDYKSVAQDVAELFKQQHISGEIYLVVLRNANVDPARGRLFSQSISLNK
ncbi:hypothetical protein [Pseudobutyrivibrio ruminis]|uniref:Uncharacterized protein n=1 Tax=Pseudobutyrivibrio ruminis DSM 9787 TaxID=1123011 RepID=A0A285RFT8_9FIRM|nr:hypothetical protein [Pseudobutyrivibrio ruminis]SOB92754.1 hypothetical protein SAMN02910411_0958 [Pseudobutyrivibrio ruminis DSM 9787]